MKKYFIAFISVLFLFSCSSSKLYLNKGQYDYAIKHAVKKLIKNPDKKKEIINLEKAFTLANNESLERIDFLNMEGLPDRWAEIYTIYTAMKDRQTIVEKVTPLNVDGRVVDFEHVDYDQLILDAKTKAATYFYAHAKKLMEDDYKEAYRQAYDEFSSVKQYTSGYKDVDSLLIVCKEKGTIHALLIFENNTIYKLPEEFMTNILDQETSVISSEWVKYYSTNILTSYDYNVYIDLKLIEISPDNISERRRTESRKINDGYDYVLDENGNVMKDSLGNDIKVPREVTIYCDIIETAQIKNATARGEVEYVEVATNETLLVRDFAADHNFEHVYAIAVGNVDALSNESRSRLGVKPVPFPADQEMLDGLGVTLKNVISNLLYENSTNLLMNY